MYAKYMDNRCTNSDNGYWTGWDDENLATDCTEQYCTYKGENKYICHNCRANLLLLKVLQKQNEEIMSLQNEVAILKNHAGIKDEK